MTGPPASEAEPPSHYNMTSVPGSAPAPPDPFQTIGSAAPYDPFASPAQPFDPFASTAPAAPPHDPFAPPPEQAAAAPRQFEDPFASHPSPNSGNDTPLTQRIMAARIGAKISQVEQGNQSQAPLSPSQVESMFAPPAAKPADPFGSPDRYSDPFEVPTEDPFAADPFAEQQRSPLKRTQSIEDPRESTAVRDYMASFDRQSELDAQRKKEEEDDDSSGDEDGYSPSSRAANRRRPAPQEETREEYDAIFPESVKKYGMLLEKVRTC